MALPTAQNQISANILKTYLIMLFFSASVVGVVYIFAKAWGFDTLGVLGLTGLALILAGIMNFISYYFSDQIVLAMSNAHPVTVENNRQLYHMIENLCLASGLPTPRIYIIDDASPNAFATGRDPNHSAIVFTSGILDKLGRLELEGVAAHELSHVRDRDTLLMSVVSILVGIVALLADWFLRSLWFRGNRDEERRGGNIFLLLGIVAAIIAPLAATLMQLAISRRREYLADAQGAYLTRNPAELSSALQKISSDPEPTREANTATAHMYIINPLKGREVAGWIVNLFNTHPPIADRIKALKEMEGQF